MGTSVSHLRRPDILSNLSNCPRSSTLTHSSILKRLEMGQPVLLDQDFHIGMQFLHALEHDKPTANSPFTLRKQWANQYRLKALRLWVQVQNHQICIQGVSTPSLISVLYPDTGNFFIPFVSLQELCGAEVRWTDGVHYPVLGYKINPFYGVYFPTRTEHLALFATWLQQYNGRKDLAVDVGTGSGILALLLAKAQFQEVIATDQNPNAVWSTQKTIEHQKMVNQISTRHCDLLCDAPAYIPLIVFNPPWIPGDSESSVDEALFFEQGLFERFFDQAKEKLAEDGRIVLIFSTILTLLRPDIPHPIEKELRRNRFKLLQRIQRRIKQGSDGRRTKEKVEIWELVHSQ